MAPRNASSAGQTEARSRKDPSDWYDYDRGDAPLTAGQINNQRTNVIQKHSANQFNSLTPRILDFREIHSIIAASPSPNGRSTTFLMHTSLPNASQRHQLRSARALMWLLIGLALSTAPARAADYYFLPDGSGSETGSDFENAMAWSELSFNEVIQFLNSTMQPGDRLFMGSGTYADRKLTLNSSGTATEPKEIIGIDTGAGRPLIVRDSWSPTAPGDGTHSHISLEGDGIAHWRITGLDLQGAQYAIYAQSVSGKHESIVLRDLKISQVRYGLYADDLQNVLIEDVEVVHYTKHAFRLERGNRFVQFVGCLADLSLDDDSWWDLSEAIPFGFHLVGDGNAPNRDIIFIDCEARNNRRNGQTAGSYWNGDGFCAENPNQNISFLNCRSFNNDDAGFDIKPEASYKDCVALGNKRNFRQWYGASRFDNCIAAYASSRGGSGSIAGFWFTSSSTPLLDYCTVYDIDHFGIHMDGSGTATLRNSLIAFADANGTYTNGSVTLESSSERSRPGIGTDPQFVAPSASWDGNGDAFNSQTYGTQKGYHNERTNTITFEIEVLGETQNAYPGIYNGEQHKDPTVTLPDTHSLQIVGNGWQMVGLRGLEITAETILEFDFTSTQEGELHGIGFDTDTGLSPDQAFQFYGTQSWADYFVEDYADSAPNTKHYRIPVGSYFTGEFSYLFFVHDHDVSQANGESRYTNIRIYNPNAYTTWAAAKGLTSGVNDSADADPDHDGKSNLHHFAFDGDPVQNTTDEDARIESTIMEDTAEQKQYLTLTIPVRTGAVFAGNPLTATNIDGLTYTIVGDSDLSTDTRDLNVIEIPLTETDHLPPLSEIETTPGADWEYRRFQLSLPIEDQPTAFLWVDVRNE